MSLCVFTGHNRHELTSRVGQIITAFNSLHSDVSAERIDGASLEPDALAETLIGTTLFSFADQPRLVIIDNLQVNTRSWSELEQWIDRLDESTEIILIEPTLDKRTKTYKKLKSVAQITEFTPKTYRDRYSLIDWTVGRAREQGVALERSVASCIVDRSIEKDGVGRTSTQTIVDQGVIIQTINIVALAPQPITLQTIDTYLPPPPSEAVFELLTVALKGDIIATQELLTDLKVSQEPHMMMGLLSSQVVNVAALTRLKSNTDVCRILGVSPYALKGIEQPARSLSRTQLQVIVSAFAAADYAMKSTAIEPWRLIQQALLEVAETIKKRTV